ncbi:PspA-IM30 family protein, partial [Xanthomonas perforans]
GESNAAAVLARFKKPAAQLGHENAGGTAPLIGQVRDVQQVPRSDS